MSRRYWVVGPDLGPQRARLASPLDPQRFRPYPHASPASDTPALALLPTVSIDDEAPPPPDPHVTPRVRLADATVDQPMSTLSLSPPSLSSATSTALLHPAHAQHGVDAAIRVSPAGGDPTTRTDRPSKPQRSRSPVGRLAPSAPEFPTGVGQLKRQRTRERSSQASYTKKGSTNNAQKTISLDPKTEDFLYLSSEITGGKRAPLYLLEPGIDLPTNLSTTALHWDLNFGKLLGRGRLGSAYRATLAPSGSNDPTLVVHLFAKLMVLAPEAHLHNGKPRSDAYPDARSALHAAWDEAEIYGHLEPVQGDIVPFYYGLVSTKDDDHTHVIALMTDAGVALEDHADRCNLYSRLQDNIRVAYRRLHREYHTLHIDTGARHVRLAPNTQDRIYLIDFEASMVRVEGEEDDDGDEEAWEMAVETENQEVEAIIAEGLAKKTEQGVTVKL